MQTLNPTTHPEYIRLAFGPSVAGYRAPAPAYYVHADDLSRILSGGAPELHLYRDGAGRVRMMGHGSEAERQALAVLRGRPHEPGLDVKHWLRPESVKPRPCPAGHVEIAARSVGSIAGPVPEQIAPGVWAVAPDSLVCYRGITGFGGGRLLVHEDGRAFAY